MYTLDTYKQSLVPVLESLKKEFSGIRANRPSTALVEDVRADCYGTQTPLKQVGSVSVQPPRQIFVQVWDRTIVPAVVAALQAANVGGTISAEANGVRISLPELSSERREELSKQTKKIAEVHRIEVRHARDEANKTIEREFGEGVLTEDQKFKLKEQVQKETERTNLEIESKVAEKVREIME
jgi:ribosome recycling factor